MNQNKQLIFSFFISILLLTSCKRNWVCECQTKTTVVPVDITNSKKEEAKAICEKYNYGIYSQTGGCKLK